MLQVLSLAVALVSGGYLMWRAVDVGLRQLRSLRALPFTDAELPAVPSEQRHQRSAGAMAGLALGDALGMPREQIPPGLARIRWGRRPGLSRGLVRVFRKRGTVSDDTQLTVAVARSLTRDGRFLSSWFCVELVRWWPARIGPGLATSKAVRRLRRGADRPGDPDSQGNGAAMRVVPIAVALRDRPSAMVEACISSARPTHRNSEAIAGAEGVVRLVRRCLTWSDAPAALATTLAADDVTPRRTSRNVDRWTRRLDEAIADARDTERPVEALIDIGTSGWVFETLPAVVFLLVRHPEDFEAGLELLFEVGGDVDTIAGLYGACIGALHGVEAFDPEQLRQIQGIREILHHAVRLGGEARGRPRQAPTHRVRPSAPQGSEGAGAAPS